MIRLVAWDFDGVLNRNFVDGAYLWSRDFEAATGVPLQSFHDHVFAESFFRILTGAEDVRDRVAAWVAKSGSKMDAESLLAWWFTRDARPDGEMLAVMDDLSARDVRQVITTNNEPRRAAFIEGDMGFGARVEAVFASGTMGVMKPDPAYFDLVATETGVAPADILLVDDRAPNVDAAIKAGWQAFLFTDATRAHFLAQVAPAIGR